MQRREVCSARIGAGFLLCSRRRAGVLHAAGEKCRTPQDAGFEDWLASTIATFVLKFFRDRCASTEPDPVAAGALALPCVGIPDELTEQCHSTEQGPLELPHGRGPYSIRALLRRGREAPSRAAGARYPPAAARGSSLASTCDRSAAPTHAQPSGTYLCNYCHFFFLGIHLSCDGSSLAGKERRRRQASGNQ